MKLNYPAATNPANTARCHAVMNTKLKKPGIMTICLCALGACQVSRQTPTFSVVPQVPAPPDVSAELMTEHKERFRELKPVTMYLDHGNLVVVEKATSRIESGKYVIPFISSYDPRLGGDGRFILTPVGDSPEIINLGGEFGMLGQVYEYRKSRPNGAGKGSQPVGSETNRASEAAGSGRSR